MTRKARNVDVPIEHHPWCARCDGEVHFSASRYVEGGDWKGELFAVQDPGQDPLVGMSINRMDHHALTPSEALRLAYELQVFAVTLGFPVPTPEDRAGEHGGWREDDTYWSREGAVGFNRSVVTGLGEKDLAEFCGFADGYGAGLMAMLQVLRPKAGMPTFVEAEICHGGTVSGRRILAEGETFYHGGEPGDLADLIASLAQIGVTITAGDGDTWWTRWEDGDIYQDVGRLDTGTTNAGLNKAFCRPRRGLSDAEYRLFLESCVTLFKGEPSTARGFTPSTRLPAVRSIGLRRCGSGQTSRSRGTAPETRCRWMRVPTRVTRRNSSDSSTH